MKQTLDFNDFRNAFWSHDRSHQFSREGLELLFDFCEDCDPDMELDVIALCCDYSEGAPEDIARDHSIDLNDADQEADDYEDQCRAIVRQYLDHHTTVVGETSSGIVYANF